MQVLPESGRNTSVDVPADDDGCPPVTKIPEMFVSLFCSLNQVRGYKLIT